ncbi:MAG: methylated-DNA--[protein]-cysteine S-methyltransferase [Nitrospirota bacterium]|nr:methylated-DNA--[protein]-cysteine S-methyltransferase [Nitrospirota bacterium]MDH5585802.1 methylated-DNA--[protein]-cysteine S-methyltransferase [Nitrospirota bacterium]MDH5774098.1 methylated-DNA--[protein]-cysteine S-methyltransferase [Nitrospirota bacterium]
MMKPYAYWILPSPVGDLLLVNDGEGLCRLQFQDGAHPNTIDPQWKKQRNPFTAVVKELEAYFAGQLRRFTIPVSLNGTVFQRAVWRALQTIPYGKTVSYGAISKKIGNPNASRAVGAANGQNPVSIIVPCHRVIGSTGKLVGYGGGLSIKTALLELEQGRR